MRILIALNHPSQYHLFKYFELEMLKDKHKVLFVINNKDILKTLLENENKQFVQLGTKKNKKGSLLVILNKGIEFVRQDIKMHSLVNKWNPDILLGTDISISHIGKLKKIPAIVFNEDDYEINKLFCKATYPFAKYIFSPFVCNVGKYKLKKIAYHGYQKLAYLHPNKFKPDINIVKKYITTDKPYFIIRLVSFSAGHDIEKKHRGISNTLLEKLVDKLNPYGYVYITSENSLPSSLDSYKLRINPIDMHHILAFSDLFIGDSQSMCVEAAILGTASIRFNSFVGKISVLEELESKYQLTHGIHCSDENKLFSTIDSLLNLHNIKETYSKRKDKMLQDKIDVTDFMVWLIKKYPESIKIIKNNPDCQYSFK